MSTTDFKLWLEFEQWVPNDLHPEEEEFSALVTLADGREYVLYVWPYSTMLEALSDSKLSYVSLPDVDLLVPEMTRASVEAAISKMIEDDELSDAWLCTDQD